MLYSILWFSVIYQQESTIGTPMSPPSQPSLPSPSPSQPSRLSQSPCLSPLSHTANSHWLSILQTFCRFPCYPLLHLILSFLPFPCVRRSVLYVCFSIAALKINSSVPFFLDSIYVCQYSIFIFLFLTYFTLYNRL